MISFMPPLQQSPHIFHNKGKFDSTVELDTYETMWHERIFTECYSTIHNEVSTWIRTISVATQF